MTVKTREEVMAYCRTLGRVYADAPFHDDNWVLMRHKTKAKRTFVFMFERQGQLWLNLKNLPEWCDFWRQQYESIQPAYHMNKVHWNSVILDDTVPDDVVRQLIKESYLLTE